MAAKHQAEVLKSLKGLLKQRALRTDFAARKACAVTSGKPVNLDYWSWLPTLCLAPGTVTEWCATEAGSGGWELALRTSQKLLPAACRWLWIDDQAGEIYPLALAGRGMDLSRLVTVRTGDLAETLWAVEQGLRSRGVEIVVCHLSKVTHVIGRRLKLAAEAGSSRCLLLRGPEAVRESCFADVRLLVSPLASSGWQHRRLQVELLKVRNGVPGGLIQVEVCDEADAVRVVSELASSTSLSRATGA